MVGGGVCSGKMASGRRTERFPPLYTRLGEEGLELGVSLVQSWFLPPIFDIVDDEDARGGDGGDGGVQDLLG